MNKPPEKHAPVGNEQGGKPNLPHEQDQSTHSQAQGTQDQRDVGRQAYDNATDGTSDTDKGPEMDRVYNEKVAPGRGSKAPRQ